LIAGAYAGHVDALINDQYRSVEGARRFLFNIVQYPGCGNFLPEASLAAFEKRAADVGICLASVVGPEVGILRKSAWRETRAGEPWDTR